MTPNLKARIPSYLLSLSLSPALHTEHQTLHKKPHYTSSAQLTGQHTVADLEGASLLAVINFPRKQIGPKMSDCLVTGVVPLGVEPEVKREGTVFVKPWMWDGIEGVEPGARVGVVPQDDALLETNPRDLTWEEFTKVHIHVGTVLGLGSPATHEGSAEANPNIHPARLIVDFGSTVGKKTAIMWLRTPGPSLDTAQLIGRQLLAVTNLTGNEWFQDGAVAVLTVNGRTVLEPAKTVDNGFGLA